MMDRQYHRQSILHAAARQKRDSARTRLGAAPNRPRAALFVAVLTLAACDAVQVVEGSDTHVSVRYDGIMNGLDQATLLAQTACAAHGRTAKLRKTYYEGLGAGERFAFFDCV
jgi:hypothetical protein